MKHPNSSNVPVNIYLTGFMGSGKSTLGKALAAQLGYTFTDLDQLIEANEKRSIADIFGQKGESYFRKIEIRALNQTAQIANGVIALGGGVIVRPDNLAWVLQNGLLIYLKVSAETLAGRLSKTGPERPLLSNEFGVPLTGSALLERVSRLLKSRKSFYEQAHVIFENESSDVDREVSRLIDRLVRC